MRSVLAGALLGGTSPGAPTLNPDAGGLPGASTLQRLADGIGGWALIAAMMGIVVGAVLWAFGRQTTRRNPQLEAAKTSFKASSLPAATFSRPSAPLGSRAVIALIQVDNSARGSGVARWAVTWGNAARVCLAGVPAAKAGSIQQTVRKAFAV